MKILWKEFDRLKLIHEILYKAWLDEEGSVIFWHIILPQELRYDFIKLAHENCTGGHLSAAKTAF